MIIATELKANVKIELETYQIAADNVPIESIVNTNLQQPEAIANVSANSYDYIRTYFEFVEISNVFCKLCDKQFDFHGVFGLRRHMRSFHRIEIVGLFDIGL